MAQGILSTNFVQTSNTFFASVCPVAGHLVMSGSAVEGYVGCAARVGGGQHCQWTERYILGFVAGDELFGLNGQVNGIVSIVIVVRLVIEITREEEVSANFRVSVIPGRSQHTVLLPYGCAHRTRFEHFWVIDHSLVAEEASWMKHNSEVCDQCALVQSKVPPVLSLHCESGAFTFFVGVAS